MSSKRPVKIISFSGIDGAGKSTQIAALNVYLRQAGLRTELLTFWDNVVAFRGFRESASKKAFKGDDGIGRPEKPLNRRDKNVQSPWLTIVRCFFYLADAINLHYAVAKVQKSATDVVVFDRYIYDELANLPLHRLLPGLFARLLMKISPVPDVALLIDADPEAARARKPEYPLDFLRINRQAYISLSHMCAEMIVIEPANIEVMEKQVRSSLSPGVIDGRVPITDLASAF